MSAGTVGNKGDLAFGPRSAIVGLVGEAVLAAKVGVGDVNKRAVAAEGQGPVSGAVNQHHREGIIVTVTITVTWVTVMVTVTVLESPLPAGDQSGIVLLPLESEPLKVNLAWLDPSAAIT